MKESELREKKRVSAAANDSSSSSDEGLITPFAKHKRMAEFVKLNISCELIEVKDGLEDIHANEWHEHPEWHMKCV